MKKILLLNSKKAYLPEIQAYKKYFIKNKEFQFYDSSEIDCLSTDFDAIWHFMGFDIKKKNIFTIHEYPSLSLGKLPHIKNFIKKKFNCKPDLRVFLNTHIEKYLGFSDNTPSCIRDMGIDDSFFILGDYNKKEYDFVYVGEISFERNVHRLLDKFKNSNESIILIGEPSVPIYKEFNKRQNIHFTGRVNYYDIPLIAAKACFAINLVPKICTYDFPYNFQTSTKLIEYLAMGLKVVTVQTSWSKVFEDKLNCKFFNINYDLEGFDFIEIKKFDYKTPDVRNYSWNEIIRKSNIETILRTLL